MQNRRLCGSLSDQGPSLRLHGNLPGHSNERSGEENSGCGEENSGCGEENSGCGEENSGCGEEISGCGEEKLYFGATVKIIFTVSYNYSYSIIHGSII